MDKSFIASLLAIGLLSDPAAAMDSTVNASFRGMTLLVQRTQYNNERYYPTCPYHYYYACRYDDPYYGNRKHCACWPYWPYWQH